MGKCVSFMFVCPVDFTSCAYISAYVFMDIYRNESLFVVFLTMAEIARIPICVKDFASYKTVEYVSRTVPTLRKI